jgi:protein-tyrosine phosphatase
MDNLSWITPALAVGGRFPMEAARYLAEQLDIRCVVDLRIECCDDASILERQGIRLLHLPTHDTRAVSAEMLDQGSVWVKDELALGKKVYIHCEHGIGRSALLAACVLVFTGAEPVRALERLKDARAVVSPSPDQLNAFIQFCERHRRPLRAAWDVPQFDALAQIAYRHLRQGA